jgi:hypothetical protein
MLEGFQTVWSSLSPCSSRKSNLQALVFHHMDWYLFTSYACNLIFDSALSWSLNEVYSGFFWQKKGATYNLLNVKVQQYARWKVKVKGTGYLITGHEGPRGGVEVCLYSFSTSALGRGGWSAPRPGRFTPGRDPVPIVQEAGWAPEPVWMCAKNLAPTRIRSRDRPARSQSLYWLSYPNHGFKKKLLPKFSPPTTQVAGESRN